MDHKLICNVMGDGREDGIHCKSWLTGWNYFVNCYLEIMSLKSSSLTPLLVAILLTDDANLMVVRENSEQSSEQINADTLHIIRLL